jgi:hypothetical protein
MNRPTPSGFITMVLRCYPAQWRKRYEAEVVQFALDLIADGRSPFRIAGSLVPGAMTAHFRKKRSPLDPSVEPSQRGAVTAGFRPTRRRHWSLGMLCLGALTTTMLAVLAAAPTVPVAHASDLTTTTVLQNTTEATVDVPPVTGRVASSAEVLLGQVGLRYTIHVAIVGHCLADHTHGVVGQVPLAGALVPTGTNVILYVCGRATRER